MAARLLRASNNKKPLSKKWITGFIGRNPRVTSVIRRRIDAARINSTSQEALQLFFNRFEATREQFNILAKNI
jgi:hypothetical protein